MDRHDEAPPPTASSQGDDCSRTILDNEPPPATPAISNPRPPSPSMPFRYTELPAELRAAIRKETIVFGRAEEKPSTGRGKLSYHLSNLAAVGTEWQVAVEPITFHTLVLKPGYTQADDGTLRDDLSDFIRIVVGERRKYLRRLVYPHDCRLSGISLAYLISVGLRRCIRRSVRHLELLLNALCSWSNGDQEYSITLNLGNPDTSMHTFYDEGPEMHQSNWPGSWEEPNGDVSRFVGRLEACPLVGIVRHLECFLDLFPPTVTMAFLSRLPNLQSLLFEKLVWGDERQAWDIASGFFDTLRSVTPKVTTLSMWNCQPLEYMTLTVDHDADTETKGAMSRAVASLGTYGQQIQRLEIAGFTNGTELFRLFFTPYDASELPQSQGLKSWPNLRSISWDVQLDYLEDPEKDYVDNKENYDELTAQMHAAIIELFFVARHAAACMPKLIDLKITGVGNAIWSLPTLHFSVSKPVARTKTALLELSGSARCAALEEAWTKTIQEERGIPLIVQEERRVPLVIREVSK